MIQHAINRTQSLDSGGAIGFSMVEVYGDPSKRYDWHRLTALVAPRIEKALGLLYAAAADDPRAPWPKASEAKEEGDYPFSELARVELTRATILLEAAQSSLESIRALVRHDASRSMVRCPRAVLSAWEERVARWESQADKALRKLRKAAETIGGPITSSADSRPMRPATASQLERTLLAARAALAAIPEHLSLAEEVKP